MKKLIFLFLIIFSKYSFAQNIEIDSLSKIIKQKEFVIDSLKREMLLLQKNNPENKNFNYCFIRFDDRFFKQTGIKQKVVGSFEFTINGTTFPVAYDTIAIPINATGLDTLLFKSYRQGHRTLLKLKPKELYTIHYNECIGTYIISASHKYGKHTETGITALFNGDHSNGAIEISLSSHVKDSTFTLKKSNTFSPKLSPTFDMCGNIPQKIELRNKETDEIYVSFNFTFIHNEKLRIHYYQKKDQLSIRIE